MLESVLRETIQKHWVDGFVTRLHQKHISPNQVTAVAMISGVGAGLCLMIQLPLLAMVLMWFSGYLDMVDGSLARCSTASPQGAAFDIISDRVVEASIILGLFTLHPDKGFLCLLVLSSILVCVTSFLVVGIFTQNDGGKSFHYSRGLIERAEAFIFFSAMMIWPAGFSLLASILVILVCWTTVVRVLEFDKACKATL